MCDNKELLVAYLYDELDEAGRRTLDAHLQSCAECREEVSGLRSTRRLLTSWAPPEPDFGFRIVRGAAALPAPPTRWFQPVWGLAAAAVLVLAAAAAIANIEVRYGQDGLLVRAGWGRDVPAAAAVHPAAAATPVLTPTTWKTDVELLDRRLRSLEAALARAQNPTVQAAAFSNMSDAELRRRVGAMLAQSELRQQQDVALRMTALAREVDRQRSADLAMVKQGLVGASGAAAARDTQMMKYLRLVNLGQQK